MVIAPKRPDLASVKFFVLFYSVFKVLYVLYIFRRLTRKFYGVNLLTGEKVMCLNNGSIFFEIITDRFAYNCNTRK